MDFVITEGRTFFVCHLKIRTYSLHDFTRCVSVWGHYSFGLLSTCFHCPSLNSFGESLSPSRRPRGGLQSLGTHTPLSLQEDCYTSAPWWPIQWHTSDKKALQPLVRFCRGLQRDPPTFGPWLVFYFWGLVIQKNSCDFQKYFYDPRNLSTCCII